MNTTTKTTTTKRPANYTKSVWENDTFRVYNGLIKLVKGEITLSQFTTHPTTKDLFEKCGVAKTPEERQIQTVNLIISMVKDRTSNGEKERHVAPIFRLRAFFNGEWVNYANRPITYKAPTAPKAPAKKASKAKKTNVPKVKNVSVDQWVKGLSEDKRDELKVALAMLEMDAA